MEGKYYFFNAGYGRALAYKGGNSATHLDPEASVATTTRIWKLEKLEGDAEFIYYNIVPVDNPSACLELKGNFRGDGAFIAVADKVTDNFAQAWNFEPRGKKGGVLNYQIYNRNVKQTVIRLVGSPFDEEGNTIKGWTDNPADSFQGWILIPILK